MADQVRWFDELGMCGCGCAEKRITKAEKERAALDYAMKKEPSE